MASTATLFVNTPYPSHSFPKPSSAHFAPVLKLSTHLGSKPRARQRLRISNRLIERDDMKLVNLSV
ncbi:hypothetical protein C1H46_021890 [Malus baccata]|uniref:Uncharacterized protein n=1 Tax=Malus baccata TaxID=106549 RepID=A0A540M1C9_MALBA|nr:hypothetical protein C1H46_021890 [Malus baccata]